MKRIFSIIILACLLASCGYSPAPEGSSTDSVTVEIVDTVQEASGKTQCHGITKDGTRCEFIVNLPDTMCHHHKK